MDYILSLIRQKKEVNRVLGNSRQYMDYCRVEVEYACVFLLGYLWNKNREQLDADVRKVIFQQIVRPSIGTIVEICRRLDLNRDFFGNRRARLSINDYPTIRNKIFGHGFVFEDGIENVITGLENISTGLFAPNSMLSEEFQIVLVTNIIGGQARGVRFGTDNMMGPWQCPADVAKFEPDNVYAMNMKKVNDYTRLSPFIIVTMERDCYLFKDIADRMTGRTIYNQLFTTGEVAREWEDFVDHIFNDDDREIKISSNGTVLNDYDRNFKQYIGIGTKSREIKNFLTENRASVCGTVWGHGGVGKTATVQSICEELAREDRRIFDYIVFASAKDREFCYEKNKIYDIDKPIDSYKILVSCINSTIGAQSIDEEQEIVNVKGKLLIIIDDYETFPHKEKTHIETLIRKLNVNNHKVLITTRARVNTIGEEFATHELNEFETVGFLKEVMQSELPNFQVSDLKCPDIQRRIFNVTGGRPLHIFQFAYLWGQKGLRNVLPHHVREVTKEFLFGRIFDYLSDNGKKIFQAISLLVTNSDLTNLVGKLRYIVDMENDGAGFDQDLEELVEQKVIEKVQKVENAFFRVYTVEILNMMQKEYNSAPKPWKTVARQRMNQVIQDKELNTEESLLKNADRARSTGRSQQEVGDLYRQILDRPSSPPDVKSRAIRNLAEYLFDDRNDKEGAIGVFEEYWKQFRQDALAVKIYATYCWSVGSDKPEEREKAIEALMNIIHIQMGNPTISGLCLMYQSRLLIDREENLEKDRKNIDQKTFKRRKKIIYQDYNALCRKQGARLYQQIKTYDLEGLESGEEKQSIVEGLYLFSRICVKVQRFNLAIEICDFVLGGPPNHLHNQFETRKREADEALLRRADEALLRRADKALLRNAEEALPRDVEEALLRRADKASDARRSQPKVINLYRQILNRSSSPPDVKSRAIRNLAEYLFYRQKDKEGAIGVFEDYWEQVREDALAVKIYATYCWSVGSDKPEEREKAIEALMNIIHIQMGNPTILGLCLIFQSRLLIDREENLEKDRKNIDQKTFDRRKKIIYQDYNALCKRQGAWLYQQIKEYGLEGLKSGEEKQNIVDGLYLFSRICVKVQGFDLAIEICDFVLEGPLNYFHNWFKTRKEEAKEEAEKRDKLATEKRDKEQHDKEQHDKEQHDKLATEKRDKEQHDKLAMWAAGQSHR